MPIARRAVPLCAVLCLTAALGTPRGARAATVWTALASQKLRPDAAARATRSGAMSAAKNEFEAFQIVVQGPATRVSVAATPLVGPGAISDVRLYREALIDLAHPSAADGATGRFPDALVPDVDEVAGEKRNAFPFDVPAGESRAVWVEVHVPANAAAGDYAGTVTVHAADGDAAVPVTLRVWDFALPSTASLKSVFLMAYGGLPRAHGVPGSGPALTALRQRYGQLALDHRISVADLWDDGHVAADWPHFDEAWGPFLAGTAATRLAGARLTSLRSGANLASAAEHGSWAAHARAKGWFDRLFQYTCDEPPITCAWGDIPARAQVAKSADPAFRTLVTTDADQARAQGVDGAIDVLAPIVNSMEDRSYQTALAGPGGEARARYDAFLAGPRKELWLYQSCMSHGCGGTVAIGDPSAGAQWWTGWPTYVVDANAVRARAMEWLSFRYGASGELYYETLQSYVDKADPWSDVYAFNGNGDGTLFYPGTPARIGGQTDVPVASIRLKMIREGMEDYEYLKLLTDAGGGDEARAIAKELFPHAWAADQKPEALMAAREAIAQRILARTGKTVVAAAGTAQGSAAGAAGVAAAGEPQVRNATIVGGCGALPGQHERGHLALLLIAAAFLWRRHRSRRAS
ncbi:MAG: glycoside hydrolase domain-containing protein [Anaeromyxobacteraceae bacterium]